MQLLDCLNCDGNTVENLAIEPKSENWLLRAEQPSTAMLHIQKSRAVAASMDHNEMYIWQSQNAETDCAKASHCWLLTEGKPAVHLTSKQGMRISLQQGGCTISFEKADAALYEPLPHADILGNRFSIENTKHDQWTDTLAAFYWNTMVPCVVEKKNNKYPKGYVLSTLERAVYAGTYPDVDHEFQCKGRIACGGDAELHVVRRMLELNFQLMAEDPTGMWRNPCALQPNGNREYHVRRNSEDGSTNAEMFLITGNVEVLESTWLYVARSKDKEWLAQHIRFLEGAASLTESCMDRMGRLWSDVYYEDQIIKDGMECMSATLAANGFHKLAQLEQLLERNEQAMHYLALEKKLSEMLQKPIPNGFWDAANNRFIDWLDRNGDTHDHLHLLSNSLPLLFDYCTSQQRKACEALINSEQEEYQRFPTFLAARIEDYTSAEIGCAYDLCAAGRYWCWDAAYWAKLNEGDKLSGQLDAVAKQAQLDHYDMGERYDMNHLYYQSERNWHGAASYYEYPCVFWWVLIAYYFGIQPSLTEDICFHPQMAQGTSFSFEAWHIACDYGENELTITNLDLEHKLSVKLELQSLHASWQDSIIVLAPNEKRCVKYLQ